MIYMVNVSENAAEHGGRGESSSYFSHRRFLITLRATSINVTGDITEWVLGIAIGN
jgi:hypothetical protein